MTQRVINLPDGVPPLRAYYFYLTAGCNLACQHCWLAPRYQPLGGTGGHLAFELFSLAIEQGLSVGLQRVKLTGGEPLLHPDFTRMIDLLRQNELDLTIETNGILLDRSLARYLKEHSTLSQISVSLDGASAETHDAFRGVKESFEKTCDGICNLVEAGFRPQIIMSLHSGNFTEIEELVSFATQMGAGSVKFNLVQPSGRGELMTNRGQVLDIADLIKLGRVVEGEIQPQTSIPLYYSWPIAFHSLHRLLSNSSDTCGIFNILGVLPDGQLAMCGIGEEIPELCYGLLGAHSAGEIWCHHPLLEELRRKLPGELEGVCGICLFNRSCLGSCVANNYHQAGRVTAPFWFCQQAEQLGLFPTQRLREQRQQL